ncbi:MAG: hypothetical protein NHB36_11605 [Nitrospira sp.]|nr:hypothetical protein [Nitrospira sp.]
MMKTIRQASVTAPRSHLQKRGTAAVFCWLLAAQLVGNGVPLGSAQENVLAFAVVMAPPTDRARIAARVSIENAVEDLVLLPTEQILSNPIWKKLEICHALKLEGRKVKDGFQVTWVRVLDSAMLPMVLQGVAGDCLLKKALEIAPFVD